MASAILGATLLVLLPGFVAADTANQDSAANTTTDAVAAGAAHSAETNHCKPDEFPGDDGSQAQPVLPLVDARIGDHALQLETAATTTERYMGLSYRCTLAEAAGMLFVYKESMPLTFTMRNTRIPLSLAFLSDALVIEEIIDMDVGPDQFFPSSQPARYVLEVNQGWFERHGVGVGDRLELL